MFRQTSEIVSLKDNDWLEKQRIAGKTVADALLLLQKLTDEKTKLTLLELSGAAEKLIISRGCTPTFKGYKGFPAAVCISVNEQLVHGIPTDYVLKDGDVVSFDLGATYERVIADSAITCIYGEPKSPEHVRLIKETETALMKGIGAVKIGDRIGVIGHAIYGHLKNCGYGVIDKYGGHGISYDAPHHFPFVANKSDKNEGVKIQQGLTIAIEPMAVIGSNRTRLDDDKWTVYGDGISAHWEHTIFVHEDRVEIITDRS